MAEEEEQEQERGLWSTLDPGHRVDEIANHNERRKIKIWEATNRQRSPGPDDSLPVTRSMVPDEETTTDLT